MGKKTQSRGRAVEEINRQWKVFDLQPSGLMLQKEAKEGKKDKKDKKDKDSDKEEEDSGKWGDGDDDKW